MVNQIIYCLLRRSLHSGDRFREMAMNFNATVMIINTARNHVLYYSGLQSHTIPAGRLFHAAKLHLLSPGDGDLRVVV